jgi:hypothetical protein
MHILTYRAHDFVLHRLCLFSKRKEAEVMSEPKQEQRTSQIEGMPQGDVDDLIFEPGTELVASER